MVGAVRGVRGVPVGVARLAVVVVVVVAALVARRGVHVGHHELGAVLGRLPVERRGAARRVLGAGRLVQLLPRLPVVAVEAAARLRRRRVQRAHGVAVRRHVVPVALAVVVLPANVGLNLLPMLFYIRFRLVLYKNHLIIRIVLRDLELRYYLSRFSLYL